MNTDDKDLQFKMILAKSGREWGPENAGLAYALRDDAFVNGLE